MLAHQLHHVSAAREEVGTGLVCAVRAVARAGSGRGVDAARAGVGEGDH